eukprot:3931826-Rhodomonas_salina.1
MGRKSDGMCVCVCVCVCVCARACERAVLGGPALVLGVLIIQVLGPYPAPRTIIPCSSTSLPVPPYPTSVPPFPYHPALALYPPKS